MTAINYAGAGLLPGMFSPCHRLTPPDGGGDGKFGRKGEWTEGAAIDALIVRRRSPEAETAEQHTIRDSYTVAVHRDNRLRHGDVIRRDADGLTLRITGDSMDGEVPPTATILLAQAPAESWEVPT